MVILVEGAEKAGKSTLISEVMAIDHDVVGRHWGPVDPDDRVYLDKLKQDCLSETVFMWDRAWPSEHIYAKLLDRNRRLKDDAWLGEWLYGRAVMASGGVRIMIDRHPAILEKYRDNSDLKVNPIAEQASYRLYAKEFGYMVMRNDDDPKTVLSYAELLVKSIRQWREEKKRSSLRLPMYAGPLDPNVIVVGESLSNGAGIPGSWLPFTSPSTIKFGRLFGAKAITHMGWTNIGEISPIEIQTHSIIACGRDAQIWARRYGAKVMLSVPHPAWQFRYANDATKDAFEQYKNLIDVLERSN